MAESAAEALTTATAASGAGGQASGSGPSSPQRSREERRAPRRGRRSGRARPSWGRGGGGRRGAGPPALGSASDCGAAGRCMITMARSLCPGAWLRKPCYLQVGRRRARRAPSFAERDLPASLLLPWVSARPNPAAPCCRHLAARPPPGAAAPEAVLPASPTAAPGRPGSGTPVTRPRLALAPLASQEPRDVTRVRPDTPSSRLGTCLGLLPDLGLSPLPGGPRRSAVLDSVLGLQSVVVRWCVIPPYFRKLWQFVTSVFPQTPAKRRVLSSLVRSFHHP